MLIYVGPTPMSSHLFLLSPADSPLYSLSYHSTKASASQSLPLSSNLPTWSTSAFAGTLTALSGATSVAQTGHPGGSGQKQIGSGTDRAVVQMIANASLDVVEEVMRTNNAMYLKAVDKFNEWTVSAFVTPGNMKFVLLHDSKNEEGIRAFFLDVWELYVKTMMNPFHTAYTPIRSSTFDTRVRASAKKHL
ncbi:transport protein particle complex subunit [Gautieria morchelliformis]|nr:transport protein particle complex subunit [Gautieria morchelliformis]